MHRSAQPTGRDWARQKAPTLDSRSDQSSGRPTGKNWGAPLVTPTVRRMEGGLALKKALTSGSETETPLVYWTELR